jgi:DNA-binding response OmpR family regulator
MGRRESTGFKRQVARLDQSATKMVLIVDDNAEIRELFTQFLIRKNLIPIPVPDGAHAQVVCAALAPDAVLLDLVLPDTDGLALIHHIKAQRPATPLVIISGWLDDDLEARCREEGADDVLPKPINLNRLGQILARLLRLPESQLRAKSASSVSESQLEPHPCDLNDEPPATTLIHYAPAARPTS